MKASILLALFGLMSTGIVPVGAKGETWPVNLWNLDKKFKNRSIYFFFQNGKKGSFTPEFRIRELLFNSGHFFIENQGNYAKAKL